MRVYCRKRICLQGRRPRLHPWVEKIPWRREWQPTPVFLPGEFHGQRSLVGCSPWGFKELDTPEQLSLHFQKNTNQYKGWLITSFFLICPFGQGADIKLVLGLECAQSQLQHKLLEWSDSWASLSITQAELLRERLGIWNGREGRGENWWSEDKETSLFSWSQVVIFLMLARMSPLTAWGWCAQGSGLQGAVRVTFLFSSTHVPPSPGACFPFPYIKWKLLLAQLLEWTSWELCIFG